MVILSVPAFLAFLMNMALYGKLFKIPFGKQLFETVQVLLPTVLFYIIIVAFRFFVTALWAEILFGVIVFCSYYVLVLPIYNINVIRIITNYFRK